MPWLEVALVVLPIIFVASTSKGAERTPTVEIMPWPANLPGPVEMERGDLLPPPLAAAVNDRLNHYLQMPELCRAIVESELNVAHARCHRDIRVMRADCAYERIAVIEPEQAALWQRWQVVVAVVVGSVLAGGVVYAVGR